MSTADFFKTFGCVYVTLVGFQWICDHCTFVELCRIFILCIKCYVSVWQHLQDILDLDMSALDWMMRAYPDVKEREDMRRIIGRYGLTGQQQVCFCGFNPSTAEAEYTRLHCI